MRRNKERQGYELLWRTRRGWKPRLHTDKRRRGEPWVARPSALDERLVGQAVDWIKQRQDLMSRCVKRAYELAVMTAERDKWRARAMVAEYKRRRPKKANTPQSGTV